MKSPNIPGGPPSGYKVRLPFPSLALVNKVWVEVTFLSSKEKPFTINTHSTLLLPSAMKDNNIPDGGKLRQPVA